MKCISGFINVDQFILTCEPFFMFIAHAIENWIILYGFCKDATINKMVTLWLITSILVFFFYKTFNGSAFDTINIHEVHCTQCIQPLHVAFFQSSSIFFISACDACMDARTHSTFGYRIAWRYLDARNISVCRLN